MKIEEEGDEIIQVDKCKELEDVMMKCEGGK